MGPDEGRTAGGRQVAEPGCCPRGWTPCSVVCIGCGHIKKLEISDSDLMCGDVGHCDGVGPSLVTVLELVNRGPPGGPPHTPAARLHQKSLPLGPLRLPCLRFPRTQPSSSASSCPGTCLLSWTSVFRTARALCPPLPPLPSLPLLRHPCPRPPAAHSSASWSRADQLFIPSLRQIRAFSWRQDKKLPQWSHIYTPRGDGRSQTARSPGLCRKGKVAVRWPPALGRVSRRPRGDTIRTLANCDHAAGKG